MDKLKTCTKCKRDLPITEYCKDKYKSDGLNSACRECKAKDQKKYRKNNPEIIKEIRKRANKKYKEKHPNKDHEYYLKNKEKINQYQKKYNEQHKDHITARQRKYKLRKKYNTTPEHVNYLAKIQNECCAICGTHKSDVKMGGGKLCIDHDHETGSVRGLLCGQCNSALGHFNHSTDILNKAIKYLETYK
jgi:hypothetical protein